MSFITTDIDVFNKQIHLMIDNLEKPPQLGDVNLIFEGGSLNGYYLIGVAMFLKELEKRGAMRVVKVSGTSIGAYIAYHYLNDTLSTAYSHSLYAKQSFIERLNLSYFKDAVKNDISGNNVSHLNNRLFISYYEVFPERKRVIQSEFTDPSDLCHSLCASAYLPILMDGQLTYSHNEGKKKSIDGGLPYLFDNANEKTLYVKLSGINKLGNMFNHRGEKNGRGRVSEGIVYAYNFFLYGETGSNICSWLSNWSTTDHVIYKLKYILCMTFSIVIFSIMIGQKLFMHSYLSITNENNDISILKTTWRKITDTFKDIIVALIN